jgi:hypothetical protein
MLDMSMGNELDEGWKNAIAGGAMALSALGAGAQNMPNVNAKQVELANKYYNVLVQRAKEDGRELDRRTLNFLKAKAENAASLKIQQSATQPQTSPQQGFPTQGSERRVSKDTNNFESKKLNEFAPNDGGGDDKSYLLQLADDLADAMYGPNKNKQEVKNISGKILAAGGNVKITWNDDSTFNVVMYHPTYFKQGHLIRLVGKGDQEDIAESKERCPQCGMTNCTCSPGKCKCKPIAGWIPNKGFEKQDVAEAEKTARVFHPQYVDVYFLEGSRREPILVNRKVPYHLIDRYLELVVKKYNLQQGRFEFRNAEEEPTKVTESVDYLEEK